MKWIVSFTVAAVIVASAACQPAKCACVFDNKLAAEIAACPSDTTFALPDLGSAAADLSPTPPAPAFDDGGVAVQDLATHDASVTLDMGPPSSCITIYRVVMDAAPLRAGRSPLSLVLDNLKIDETVTAFAETDPFSGDLEYRIVQRANAAACGYVTGAALVATPNSRTTQRAVNPLTDSATCIGGR